MRFALILSLVLAILAVVFALQNPAYMNVNIGPWNITESTALVLMITFAIGVLVGVLATVPTVLRRRKRIRELERSASEPRTAETPPKREPVVDPDPRSVTRPDVGRRE